MKKKENGGVYRVHKNNIYLLITFPTFIKKTDMPEKEIIHP